MGSVDSFQALYFLILSSVCVATAQGQGKIFNVMHYGAVADGKTDNSKAFSNAWNAACQWNDRSHVFIPSGTFLVRPLLVKGPCKGTTVFQLEGILKAPTDTASLDFDHWFTFQYVDQLIITGGGLFDGQGASAWPYSRCQYGQCRTLPISIRLDFITNSWVNHITSIDSKNFHFNVFACENLTMSNIRISAPGDSPNTDGIHIGNSTNINIFHSTISTGDDCISLVSGSKSINVSDVFCGPGHGISVGSLGRSKDEETVKGLMVKNCTFTNTTNGVRIKTWAPSNVGLASSFVFEDITVNDAYNPIIIDQQYCPFRSCYTKASSNIQIKDVRFSNIRGISSSRYAVNLQCSKSKPCEDIKLDNINLAYHGTEGSVAASCSNVYGSCHGRQTPPSCL